MALIVDMSWDTSFFGFKISKLCIEPKANNESLKEAASRAKERGCQCLYFEIPAEDHGLASFCQKNGFQLVSRQITLIKKSLKQSQFSQHVKDNLEDKELLPFFENIAKQISVKSRFYSDKLLNNKCGDLYKLWIKKSILEGYSEKYFFYMDYKTPVGFISLRKRHDYLFIDLFGVDKEHRGRGIGSKLLSAGENWAFSKGYNEIRTITQKTNKSLRVYQKNGFNIYDQKLFYHKWIEANV